MLSGGIPIEQRIWTKPAKALPWYLLGLAVMASVAWGFALAYDRLLAGLGTSGWAGMAGAVMFLAAAVIAHIAGRKRGKLLYIASYCLNLAAAGFSVGTYYACSGMIPTAPELAPGGLWAAAAGVIACLGMLCPRKRWQVWWLLLSVLAALGLTGYSIFRWVVCPVTGSFQTFCAFAFLFFLIACAGNRVMPQNEVEPTYPLSIAGFGAYGLITFVVLLVLTEGEILEGVGEFFAELLGDLLPGRKSKL